MVVEGLEGLEFGGGKNNKYICLLMYSKCVAIAKCPFFEPMPFLLPCVKSK